jgi:hypothetical protein
MVRSDALTPALSHREREKPLGSIGSLFSIGSLLWGEG